MRHQDSWLGKTHVTRLDSTRLSFAGVYALPRLPLYLSHRVTAASLWVWLDWIGLDSTLLVCTYPNSGNGWCNNADCPALPNDTYITETVSQTLYSHPFSNMRKLLPPCKCQQTERATKRPLRWLAQFHIFPLRTENSEPTFFAPYFRNLYTRGPLIRGSTVTAAGTSFRLGWGSFCGHTMDLRCALQEPEPSVVRSHLL